MTYHTEGECPCPVCGTKLDAATGVPHEMVPEVGDWSVCAVCSALLVFTCVQPLAYRVATFEEAQQMRQDRRMQAALMASKHYRDWKTKKILKGMA